MRPALVGWDPASVHLDEDYTRLSVPFPVRPASFISPTMNAR